MAIAILGWGSLLWDLEILEPNTDGDWRMGAGPRLPMEFCRISPKRKMGLVVCLDAGHGVPCATHAIASRRGLVEEAQRDLAARERAPLGMIGTATAGGEGQGRPEIRQIVSAWCVAHGWDAAVWTDLRGNFAEHRGEEFTLERGHAYLQTLQGPNLDEAVRYIALAPRETDTPLRRRLSDCTWWQGEVKRLDLP